MTEDEAFTAAICENPRDDDVRLVYADWLDERGDPRGEWLRIQVQLKQLVANGRSYQQLANRQKQLEEDDEINRTWLARAGRPAWRGTEIRDWREFYDSLLIERVGREMPVPKPTIAQLDQFEAETGFRLPKSYREYILVFGPGKLLRDWEIAAPGYDRMWYYDLQGMHDNLRSFEETQHQHWYFCVRYKDFFYWDTAEITAPEAHECAIHRVGIGSTSRVADTFRGFVEEVLLEILTAPGWDEEELGTHLRFELATRPSEPATGNGATK